MTFISTTHAEGCYTWGPKHYECALRHITELEKELTECLAHMQSLETHCDCAVGLCEHQSDRICRIKS